MREGARSSACVRGCLGARRPVVLGLDSSVRVHIFFCAFLKNRHNKLHFSVSADFFYVCIVTHRKIIQFFYGFSYFSVGIFWNRQKNHNFSVRTEKNTQKNLSPTEKCEIPVVNRRTELLLHERNN